MAEQITVLTQLIAKPGRETAVRDALLRGVAPTRAEVGNVRHAVHELKNNAAAFYVLETWSDRGALDAYRASPRVPTLFSEQAAPDLVAPPMQRRARMLSRPDTRADRPRPVAGSSAQVTLVPFFTSKEGKVDAVRQAHLAMVDSTRAEPGCLDYDLYETLDTPTVMFFYENWTDAATLARHMNTPNFYRFVRGEVDPGLVVPWSALIMTMISDPGSG